MGALLALGSALSYGLSDFLGGVLSRRVSFVRVALLGQVGGLVTVVLAAPLLAGTRPGFADLAWGALSGVGTGVGMTFLFRGMANGAMSVVVPVSAVGGVALPVLVGAAVLGDRPAPLAWVGIALAVPALWGVSRGPAPARSEKGNGVADGLIAGAGIALQYLALARSAPEAGVWPVAAGRVTAIVAVAVLAVGVARIGRAPSRPRSAWSTSVVTGAASTGVLAALALVCYLYATRTEFLAVAVVLSSLYPVVPVVLGVTAFRERLGRAQALGLAGALAGSALIAVA